MAVTPVNYIWKEAQVQAVKLTAANLSEAVTWVNTNQPVHLRMGVPGKMGLAAAWIEVVTPERILRAYPGDYLIRQPTSGEIFPVEGSVFERRAQPAP